MVRPWQFHITAGVLCLDFANTLSWRRMAKPTERLRSAADLASWARQAGVISRAAERRLNAELRANPTRGGRWLAEARRLRESIFEVFAAHSEGREPSPPAMAMLEGWIREAVRNSRLVFRADTYQWQLHAVAPARAIVLRVALSAEALLRSGDLARLGQCSGRDCRWLWVDHTRNQSRRWCDMAVCGNRAKAHRHHVRLIAKAS
jgi:predicted RNA-binding Zn ribbon-like protein